MQEQRLAKAEGRYYAGSWIERQGNGNYRFVVASTRVGAPKAGAELEIRGARPRSTAGSSTCRPTAWW
jgi:streptogrisin C